jgi:hypothetical protein
MGLAMGLSEDFSRDLLKLIHNESIRVQEAVMNTPAPLPANGSK